MKYSLQKSSFNHWLSSSFIDQIAVWLTLPNSGFACITTDESVVTLGGKGGRACRFLPRVDWLWPRLPVIRTSGWSTEMEITINYIVIIYFLTGGTLQRCCHFSAKQLATSRGQCCLSLGFLSSTLTALNITAKLQNSHQIRPAAAHTSGSDNYFSSWRTKNKMIHHPWSSPCLTLYGGDGGVGV